MSHALLSPSAAHRWLNCTKSVRLEEKFEDRGSDAAMEGTVAHAICAHLLKTLITDGTYDVKILDGLSCRVNRLYGFPSLHLQWLF